VTGKLDVREAAKKLPDDAIEAVAADVGDDVDELEDEGAAA
jgi:hypothetical protein